jgi:lysophospholipase L1-like esterase
LENDWIATIPEEKQRMKKEWALLAGVVAVTTMIVLASVRWFAPQLLGIPIDLQSVRVSDKVNVFYDGIFNSANSKEILLKDPYIRVRARPLLPRDFIGGPHDLLGFRNYEIPNVADVIILGDSQTYGNNAFLEFNWPSQLQRLLGNQVTIYSMATGGWGAVQYFDIFMKSLFFRPQAVVVAFYSGNDPLESYMLAYDVEKWAQFKVTEELDESDRAPAVTFPAPPEQSWPVTFSDGIKTVFTPSLRLQSNDVDFAVVREGWAIMEKAGQAISELAEKYDIALVYTIIPTKELAYKRKIDAEGITPDPVYKRLVLTERANIERLGDSFSRLKNVTYIEMVTPLQQAALRPVQIYQQNNNGHPIRSGYMVIAQAITPVLKKLLPPVRTTLTVATLPDNSKQYLLLTKQGAIGFDTPETAARNGWKLTDARLLRQREFTRLPFLGVTNEVAPSKLGPVLDRN